MKTQFYFLFILTVLLASQSEAQIAFEQDTILKTILSDNYSVLAHNNLTSDAPDIITYRWVRTEVIMPDGWTSAICDINTCYDADDSSSTFEMGPTNIGLMDVHAYPASNWSEYAVIEIVVSEVGNPTNTATGIYIYNSQITGTAELQKINFKVYPNPTQGLFTMEGELENVKGIEVFSITGQRMFQSDLDGNGLYNIAHLPGGTYMLKLFEKDGRFMGSKLICKK